MSKPGQNLVNVKLNYMELEDGEPVEREKERYMYFTFRSFSDFYKKAGVDENKARDYAEEIENLDDDEAREEFERQLEEEVEVGTVEMNYLLIWAALQWDARQRGETLTVEEVGDMVSPGNAERLIIQAQRAMQLFQTGSLPSYEEVKEQAEDEAEDAPEDGAEGKTHDDPASVGSPR